MEVSVYEVNKSFFLSNFTQKWGRREWCKKCEGAYNSSEVLRKRQKIKCITLKEHFCFPVFVPGNGEQGDGPTPTCVLLHIYLIYVSLLQVEPLKNSRRWSWFCKTDNMVSEKDILVAAAVFVLALVSHSEFIPTCFFRFRSI